MDIKNIYCVGRNYSEHAKELGDKVPDEPMLFSKPTHALSQGKEQHLQFPGHAGAIHYEAELVILIKDYWKKDILLEDLIESFTVGIDFTMREKQEEMKQKRYPWLIAKGFPNSAAVGPFYPFKEDTWEDIEFSLYQNSTMKQNGTPKKMIFPLRELVDFTGEHLGLGPGDLLFTGTPEGVGPVADGDELKITLNGEEVSIINLKIRT